MRKLIISVLLFLPLMATGTTKTISSPNGKVVVSVSDDGGKPVYSVVYDGGQFLNPSPLGLVTNIGDYTQGLSISKASDVKTVKVEYQLPNIKKSDVSLQANQQTLTMAKNGKDVIELTFHVSDNDVAFRYRVLPVKDTRCCTVSSEATGFAMPEGTTTFLCPQSKPMGGFARTSPSYETNYDLDQPTGKNGWGEGYSFPCLFKIGGKGWMLISETGVGGDYCASRLLGNADGSYTVGYPQQGEMNGFGSTFAAIALPGYTPWRTITIGRTLAPIAETTIAQDVVERKYEPSKKYEYGRGTWSWIIGMDSSCNYDEQKRYIDFAAAMGYESVLVDALWDTQIGYQRMEQLARYGRQKGVALYLWYNSNGTWNDAPQGPRGKMDNSYKRRKEMAWMQKNGIRGIKVDFFGGDKQDMMRLYDEILSDANDFGLLVIFHGCTIPRGWERMYPNYAASEAVLASENLHFSQNMCDAEARNACIHPFIRNTIGSMDFGGSTLNKFYNADNKSGSQRRTSDVFALATAVLFQSPVQHFALAPNNLTDAPAWAVDFMKNVPTTWDDIKFIDGYPGKYVILARRHGDKWFVAGINAQKEPLKATLTLPMFSRGDVVKLYSDNAKLQGSLTEAKVGKGGTMKITIPCNGGVVIEK